MASAALLKLGTLGSTGVTVSRAAFIAVGIYAGLSSFNAAECKQNFTVSIAAVSVRAATVDVGLEATGSVFGALHRHLQALVLGVATAVSNINACIAFESTLHS